MKQMTTDGWTRRGISLLWDANALADLANPEEVITIRELVALRGQWPEDLPSNHGNTLVVAGLEGCLDVLSPDDGAEWLAAEAKDAILAFQDAYGLDAALVWWLPGGRSRIEINPASEEMLWRCVSPNQAHVLEIGRILFSGAAADANRIMANTALERNAWIGIHCPRVS